MGTHSFPFLPGTFHGQRSLVGYSLSMGYKESGTTEYRAQYMQTCREHSPMTLKHYKIAEDIIIHFLKYLLFSEIQIQLGILYYIRQPYL